ncbi:hypothetical protein BDZ97DRAFT_1843736, partial [Flammula alnicola]
LLHLKGHKDKAHHFRDYLCIETTMFREDRRRYYDFKVYYIVTDFTLLGRARSLLS